MPSRSAPSPSLRLALCLVLTLAAVGYAFGQATPAAPPPLNITKRALVGFIDSRRHAEPDTLAAFNTGAGRTNRFRTMVEALADQDWGEATTLADQIAYDIVALKESNAWFAIAFDRRGRDPTVIVNLKPRRELIVGAPHVGFERGTGEQAVILLRDTGARAAIVNGAHRCASTSFTTCDGTTAVCGTLEAYRASDVGHNVDTLFHVAHVALAQRWPNALVMSLHGMADDDEGVRTAIVLSNGATADDDARETAATRLRVLMGRELKPNGTVVSCNLSADAQYDFRQLCGTTNVQGRHVNGDANACTGGVSQGTGRFIHIEQDRSVRDPYADDWQNIGGHPAHNALIAGLLKLVPRVE
jgi:hypothetical protein